MGAGRKISIAKTVTFLAGGVIVADTFVKLDSNGAVVQSTDGAEVIGVAQHAAASGAYVEVAIQNAGNIVKVASGAAVTQGAKVASKSDGKCIDAAAADIEVGQALEGSGAEDEYAIILLMRAGTA